jgi:hypothetical protein
MRQFFIHPFPLTQKKAPTIARKDLMSIQSETRATEQTRATFCSLQATFYSLHLTFCKILYWQL